jgi:hypothetical protein
MHAVISAFNDSDTAQRALNRLVQAGIPRQDVHIQERAPAEAGSGVPEEADERLLGNRATRTAEREVAVGSGALESLGHFFTSLFGVDTPQAGHAHVYSEAVRRGRSVVVVDTANEEEASRAVELMHDLGGVDVHEQGRSEGWGDIRDPQPHRMDRGGVRVFPRPSSRPLREELSEEAHH